MPEYTYECNKCKSIFSLISSIRNYQDHPVCNCGSKETNRCYVNDCLTINGSVKKSDSELKTIGDLANRNRDRMSNDQKQELETKHNSYKEQDLSKPLPKGMSRIKRPKSKIKWR